MTLLDDTIPTSGSGFSGVVLVTVPPVSERPRSNVVAPGRVTGNRTSHDVRERAGGTVEDVAAVVAVSLENAFGAAPIRVPMEAAVPTADRPTVASVS